MNYTVVKTSIACSRTAGGGIDFPEEQGPYILRYSFSWTPPEEERQINNLDILIDPGDKGADIAGKINERARSALPSGRSVYATSVTRQYRAPKTSRFPPGTMLQTDELELAVSGATHVDAGTTVPGKVTFSGLNLNDRGGGFVVGPVKPPKKPPPPVDVKRRLRINKWKEGEFGRWKESLKDSELKQRAGVRVWLSEKEVDQLRSEGAGIPPTEPPGWPPEARHGSKQRGDPHRERPRLGMILVGGPECTILDIRRDCIVSIPFLHVHDSASAQMEEIALRLDRAGVGFSYWNDVLIPKIMPDGSSKVRLTGFVESVDVLPYDRPFPWGWVLWPRAGEMAPRAAQGVDLQESMAREGRASRMKRRERIDAEQAAERGRNSSVDVGRPIPEDAFGEGHDQVHGEALRADLRPRTPGVSDAD